LTFSTQIGGASNIDEGIFWSGQAGGTDAKVDALLAKAAVDNTAGAYTANPISAT